MLQLSAVMVQDMSFAAKNCNLIEMTFDRSVTVTEFYYPSFSLPDFCASVGGALGLWLGVGVVQMGELLFRFITYLCKTHVDNLKNPKLHQNLC